MSTNTTTAQMSLSSSNLTVESFGQHTFLPITLQDIEAHVSATLPGIGTSIVTLTLSLTNDACKRRNVSSKVRMNLPTGAKVTSFEVYSQDQNDSSFNWYPATPVSKRAATEIVYREKEKGRSVAAASNKDGGGNTFEIEVSPLPYKTPVPCRLKILMPKGTQIDFFLDNLFPASTTSNVGTTKSNHPEIKIHYERETPTGTLPTAAADEESATEDVVVGAVALVGDAFNKRHFVCHIPPISQEQDETLNPTWNRICVVWDTSASMTLHDPKKATTTLSSRLERLQELFQAANVQTCELYALNFHETPQRIGGDFLNFRDLSLAIQQLDYDGGTNLSSLHSLVKTLSNRTITSSDPTSKAANGVDVVLVFTDGKDSFGEVDTTSQTAKDRDENMHTVASFPVHCIADSMKDVHLGNLNRIAALSSLARGTVLLPTPDDDRMIYVSRLLHPSPVMKYIATDQDEDAFMQDIDDGFTCIPDHRLASVNIDCDPKTGWRISGVLQECGGKQSSVQRLTAQIILGSEVHEYKFRLQQKCEKEAEDKELDVEMKDSSSDHQRMSIVRHHCRTIELTLASQCSMLGRIFAQDRYAEIEQAGFKSGMDLKTIREELAVQYGFCSPEASLLMLYKPKQFLEYGIFPPIDHPAWKNNSLQERFRKLQQTNSTKTLQSSHEQKQFECATGEIGGVKTDEQKDEVKALARRFDAYFSSIREVTRTTTLGNHRHRRRGDHDRSLGGLVESEGRRQNYGGGGGGGMSRERYTPPAFFCDEGEDEEEIGTNVSSDAPVGSGGGDGWFDCRGLGDEYDVGEGCAPPSVDSSDEGEDEEEICTDVSSNYARPLLMKKEDEDRYHANLLKAVSLQDDTDWKRHYRNEKKKLEEAGSTTPSFFLGTAQLLLRGNKHDAGILVASNCLELGVEDVQMFRSVAYLMLSAGTDEGFSVASKLFERVRELAPLEPQSFLDSALVRYWAILQDTGNNKAVLTNDHAKGIAQAQGFLVHILTHVWPNRFAEVEWPALLLLHYIADLVKITINPHLPTATLSEWPEGLAVFANDKEVQSDQNRVPALFCSSFDPLLTVWLGWDTDKTDVDLHVMEPNGSEVYYNNKRGKAGSILSRDFTNGYGPEVYLLKDVLEDESKAGENRQSLGMVGNYNVRAKYYASHQDSALTGSTSCVIWIIEKTAGNVHKAHFSFTRLTTGKEMNDVANISIT